MIINETFYSIQGEGLLTGVPSVFIRLAGCPLRCEWCDTKYALDPNAGDDLDIPQIIDKVSQWDCKFAVLTGGEPMTNSQLPELADALKKLDKHITIETAGIKFIPDIACDLMSISPKTSNSGEAKQGSDPFFTVRQLINRYPYQLKFVVDCPDDLTEIQETIKKLGDIDKGRVMLMPQAKTRKELIEKSPLVADLCKRTGFTFCNRLQILLYDGRRGL
jgi:7-carboxy-7-deazaguanine synthase